MIIRRHVKPAELVPTEKRTDGLVTYIPCPPKFAAYLEWLRSTRPLWDYGKLSPYDTLIQYKPDVFTPTRAGLPFLSNPLTDIPDYFGVHLDDIYHLFVELPPTTTIDDFVCHASQKHQYRSPTD
jgi:hypothetical protein